MTHWTTKHQESLRHYAIDGENGNRYVEGKYQSTVVDQSTLSLITTMQALVTVHMLVFHSFVFLVRVIM